MPSDENITEFLSTVQHKILVMSGKGGVGKSTVAANLAVMLSNNNFKVGLLDIDFHGPSIAGMLGLTGLSLNTIGNQISPHIYNENLKVVSMQCLLDDPDSAVIWRGPMKIGVIRQLLTDVNWGHLDYLIIDSPPGTGDEPLTIAQTIPDAKAVIVTTPQEVALADVRKSLHFCRQLNMEILGVIENMSYFICPDCNSKHAIFKTGGGKKMAEDNNIPLLGQLPLDSSAVDAGDNGQPICLSDSCHSTICSEMQNIAHKVITITNNKKKGASNNLKIAIPTAEGKLTQHFGHCQQFTICTIANNNITKIETLVPPPHEPGVLPNWLAELGVTLVIAGGMGQGAQTIFAQHGIKVICGATPEEPQTVITKYLNSTLTTGDNACDH